MAHSLEYKNGKLTIPFSVIKEYIEGLLDAYHTLMGDEKCYSRTNKALMNMIENGNFCDKKVLQSLLIDSNDDYTDESDFCSIDSGKLKKDLSEALNGRVTECSSHIEKFIYSELNAGNDFTPFRIFDGKFLYPYFQTFIHPQEVDSELIYNHFMMSSIGTALVGYNISQSTLDRPINTRTFKVTPLTGEAKIKAFDNIFSKLPLMLLNAFNNKEDIVVDISQRLFNEIKVWSLESQEKIEPMKSFFTLSKELPDEFKVREPQAKDPISNIVSIQYKLDPEDYRCGSAAFKIHSNVTNKSGRTPLIIREKETKQLLEYLSGPKDKINYKVNGDTSTILNIPVLAKKSVADVILSKLALSKEEFTKDDKLLIEIDQEDVPFMEVFFHYVLEDLVKNFLLVESNISCDQRIELESQCAHSFYIAGMNAQCVMDS